MLEPFQPLFLVPPSSYRHDEKTQHTWPLLDIVEIQRRGGGGGEGGGDGGGDRDGGEVEDEDEATYRGISIFAIYTAGP